MKRQNKGVKVKKGKGLKHLRKIERKSGKRTVTFKGPIDINSLAKTAEKRELDYAIEQGFATVTGTSRPTTDNSTRTYYKEFQKVVEAADVILQVLDARDPLGTRCKQVEQAVLDAGSSKRLVLVINKADLVPRANLEKWLKYLRREYPTIAFKASTQAQARRLGRGRSASRVATERELKTSLCLGANLLLKILGNYCRNKDIRTSIRVGVVGLPNVGKSSIINSLKRRKACNVGATPGVTKAMQEVLLDSKIKLLDCPGLVFASGNSTDSSVALKNALKVESLDDPITPVDAILQRANKEQLMSHYGLPDFKNAQEFLCLKALKMGRLKRGGVPDVEGAAKTVLMDWNSGKIKYFTEPPEDCDEVHISAAIVSEMAKEFDIASLELMETEEFQKLSTLKPSDTTQMTSSSPFEAAEGKVETMDTKPDGETTASSMISEKVTVELNGDARRKRRRKVLAAASESKASKEDETLMKIEGNQQLNKLKKLELKRLKKKKAKCDKVASSLADILGSTLTTKEVNDGDDNMFDLNISL